jgi:membrane-bound lytic murein transglycosylase A
MKFSASFKYVLIIFAAFFTSNLLTGCAIKKEIPPTPVPALKRVRFSAPPAFSDDLNFDGLNHCIEQSIAYLKRLPSDRRFRFGNDMYTSDHMILSLTRFLNFIGTKPNQKELRKFIRQYYIIYRSAGNDGTGKVLFTGYYEPTLRGSLNQSDVYRYPVYARPKNLLTIDLSQFSSRFKNKKIFGRVVEQTVVPYYDREEV